MPADAMLKKLKDPAWNPRDSILLEAAHPLPPASPPPGAVPDAPTVDLSTYTPHDIVVHVRSAQSGYILINDQFDPDWQVQINRKPAELLRADFILRAIVVPPGESTITMHYAARYNLGRLKLPAVVMNNLSDFAMLAAWIVAGLALWRQRLKSPVA
jgi:hypothetical protein